MRTTIIAITAAVSVLFAVPSQASGKPSKQESIGVGSGALIGAIAGGPVGLIVGAAVGAKIGDTMHQKNERIDNLRVSMASSSNTVVRLENDVDALSGEIERLQNVAQPELAALLQAGIAMDLLFRTDEAVLADTTGDRLAQLGVRWPVCRTSIFSSTALPMSAAILTTTRRCRSVGCSSFATSLSRPACIRAGSTSVHTANRSRRTNRLIAMHWNVA
ncbi:MAG: hypothetical protein OER91_12445 [Gammaproteobacteria bacterium]|nr:hypothetical protein [Gammaproteobacteria bacterium]